MIYIQEEKPHLVKPHQEKPGLPYEDMIETAVKKRKEPLSLSFQPVDHEKLSKKAKLEQRRLAALKMTPLQSKFIDDTMRDIREKEMAKRNDDRRRRYAVASSGCLNGRNGGRDDWTSIFLDRLGRNPSVAQIIATSGGLVTYWNDAFSNITRSSPNKSSVTIFDLVKSHCLPNLYGMLALALHNISIVEDILKNDDVSERHDEEESVGGSTHLSITLPCKPFKDSSTSYDISIIFMDDLSSRCFIGLLTPSSMQGHSQSIIGNEVGCLSSISTKDEHNKKDLGADSHCHCDVTTEARRLPQGIMLRLHDDLLCRLIFDCE